MCHIIHTWILQVSDSNWAFRLVKRTTGDTTENKNKISLYQSRDAEIRKEIIFIFDLRDESL